MKKQLLAGAFVLASFLTAQAQEVVYSEDFEDFDEVYPETGASWIGVDSDGDGQIFGGYNANADFTAAGFTGNVMGSPNFTIEGTGNQAQAVLTENSDNTVLSVFIETPVDTELHYSFKLATFAIEQGATAPYEVYVLTQDDLADVVDDATFTTMLDGKTAITSGTAADTPTTINVDASDFAGQTIAVAIRHRNANDLAFLLMDDFILSTGILATDDHLASSIAIYPNPTTNVVYVSNAENILVNGVTVTDLNGRTVKTAKFGGVAEAQVNVSDLASGVYMMTISSDKGSLTKKIVKN